MLKRMLQFYPCSERCLFHREASKGAKMPGLFASLAWMLLLFFSATPGLQANPGEELTGYCSNNGRSYVTVINKSNCAQTVYCYEKSADGKTYKMGTLQPGHKMTIRPSASKANIFSKNSKGQKTKDLWTSKCGENRTMTVNTGCTSSSNCKMHATFKNTGCKTIEVYWNDNGHLRSYGHITKGGKKGIDTYKGHKWVFKVDGKVINTLTINTCNNTTYSIDSKGCQPVCEPLTHAGKIKGGEKNCGPYNPGPLYNDYEAYGGKGSHIIYQWQVKDVWGGQWKDINGATGKSYDPGHITSSKWYRRLAKRKDCGNFIASNVVDKHVNTPPTLVCEANINHKGWKTLNDCQVHVKVGDKVYLSVNPNNAPKVKWTGPNGFSATGNSGGDVLIAHSIKKNQGGHYKAVLTDENGCKGETIIEVVVKEDDKCVPLTNAGKIKGLEKVCGPYDPAPLVNKEDPFGGKNGKIVYQWQVKPEWGGQWQNIEGANGKNYDPPLITKSKWYRRLAKREGCGEFIASNVVDKHVLSIPTLVCESNINNGGWKHDADCKVHVKEGDKVMLSVNPNEGTTHWTGPNGFSKSGVAGVGDVLISENIKKYQGGKYKVVLTTKDGCKGEIYIEVIVKEDDKCVPLTDAGKIRGGQRKCGPYDPAPLMNEKAASGGKNGEIVYQWQVKPEKGGQWQNIQGANGKSYDPGLITASKWYRRLAKRKGCGEFIASNVIDKHVIDPPLVEVSKKNADCESKKGSITFTFEGRDDRTNIEFSIDGGKTFKNVADNSGSLKFKLAPGTYELSARWGNDDCEVDLGTKTIKEAKDCEEPCVANAGTIKAKSGAEECLKEGETRKLIAKTNGDQNVPAGYSKIFVLTRTNKLVIEAVNDKPEFAVNKKGTYRIHTLVYVADANDKNFLDLSVVEFGKTEAAQVLEIIEQNEICADLDVEGAKFRLEKCEAPCDIAIVIKNKQCDGKGTADKSDDTYTFTIVVNGSKGGKWEGGFSNGFLGSFQFGPTNYGEEIELGPFPAGDFTPSNVNPPTVIEGGLDISINVNAVGDTDCKASRTVKSTGPCSPGFAALGDFVFLDANQDGIQDDNEEGISGVVVKLQNANMEVIDETTTNTDGFYEFTGLEPGDYFVEFMKPANLVASPKNVGGNDDVDSDADPETGKSDLVSLEADEFDRSIDAGFYVRPVKPGSVGDFVFEDLNGNGCQDADEPGVEGVKVKLRDENGNLAAGVKFTDAEGLYCFDNVMPGKYKVEFTAPDGYEFTDKDQNNTCDDTKDSDANTNGLTSVFTVGEDQKVKSIDAGLLKTFVCTADAGTLKPASNTNDVCLKKDASIELAAMPKGDRDVPAGYKVLFVLTKGDDLVIEAVSSEPSFEVSMEGTYRIHTLVYTDNENDENFLDLSVVSPGQTTGADVVSIINDNELCASLDVHGARFHVDACAEIGDLVFEDLNKNGCQDPNEPGVEGVKVKLRDADMNLVAGPLFTNAEGKFCFTDVVEGSYRLEFELPEGYSFTAKDQNNSCDDTKDSDANATGMTDPFTVEGGQAKKDVDAGIVKEEKVCTADAGTLKAKSIHPECLGNEPVRITAQPNGDIVVPEGYSVLFVLTKGDDLIIQNVNTAPEFMVAEEGTFRIHTLVFSGDVNNEDFLDLSGVVPGQTSAASVLQAISDNELCAALDVDGATFVVELCEGVCTLEDGGEIAGDEVQCGVYDPAMITNVFAPKGANNVSYRWEASTSSAQGPWMPIINQTGATLDPVLVSQTTWYRRIATQEGCDDFASNVVVKKVDEKPIASFEVPSKICAGSTTTLAITSPQDGAKYSWTLEGAESTSAEGTSVEVKWMAAGMYDVTVVATLGSCETQLTRTVEVEDCCDNVVDGGEIAEDETGCGPFDPAEIVSVKPATGGSGVLEYLWMSTTDVSLPLSQWDIIENSNGENYDPGKITETTFYIRCARREGCPEFSAETNVVVKTVEDEAECASQNTWIELKGKNPKEKTVSLNWEVEVAQDDATYHIEKSDDNKLFKPLADTKELAYEDNSDMKVLNYYRVRQVNTDGSIIYSNVVKVGIRSVGGRNISFNVYPNPSQSYVRLKVDDKKAAAKNYMVQITDMQGQVHFKGTMRLNEGKRINIDQLPEGNYTVVIVDMETGEVNTEHLEKLQ